MVKQHVHLHKKTCLEVLLCELHEGLLFILDVVGTPL